VGKVDSFDVEREDLGIRVELLEEWRAPWLPFDERVKATLVHAWMLPPPAFGRKSRNWSKLSKVVGLLPGPIATG